MFAIAGREGSNGFIGAYSFAAHNFNWRKILNGGGASPEDVVWPSIYDLEIAVDGLSFWAMRSDFYSVYVPAGATCNTVNFNQLLRLDAACCASFWGVPTVRPISGFTEFTQVSGLAADASGRLNVVGRRFAAPNPALACMPQVTGLKAALLEPSGAAFNLAWESTAALTATDAGAISRGFASGGGRLFLAGGFYGSGGQISFGGGALAPSPTPHGAIEFLHRLKLLTGAWYFEEDWVAGQTVTRPPKTLAGVQPSARLPGAGVGSGDGNMHWDVPTQQLFALHPAGTTVTLEWATGTCSVTTTQVCGVALDCPGVESCNASVPGTPVETYGVIRWPDLPQLHLAGAPATIGSGSPAFSELLYGDAGASAVVGGIFQRATAGYCVLKYAGPALQVVQSIPWESWVPIPVSGGVCTVGTGLAVLLEHADAPRLGYPLPGSPIDIQDVFDVTTRLGELVPVNTTTPTRQMRIAWYAAGGFGRAWPTVPRTYDCAWPASPAGILFPDSLMGADACWADLSEGNYGVSLLNDCKYSYDIKGNVMRLSLLRAPVHPDPDADQGEHDMVYSLYPHDGDWRNGTVEQGYELNTPLITVAGVNAEAASCFASLDADNVLIDAVKKAEDSNALIVRMYEAYGQRGEVLLSFARAPKSIAVCDMMEENDKPVKFKGHSTALYFTPYEIKSPKVQF